METQLSTHFRLSEFTRSTTADRLKIDNTPSIAIINWLQYLCLNVLEPLRTHMNRPLTISSGYRSPKLNTIVGGVANSRHQYGQAADIVITSAADGRKIFDFLAKHPLVDCVLFERSKSTGNRWIHVNVAPKPRHYANDDYAAR